MPYKYKPPTGNVQTTRADITAEFKRWNEQAGEKIITDYDLPYAYQGTIEAEVVFILRGQKLRVKIGVWDSFATNLRCCYLNIRDMRLAEARGSLEAMIETFMALPAPARERDPYEVLGIRPDAPLALAEAAYKHLINQAHPDKGGTDAQAAALNAAIEKVRAR